MYFLVEYLKGLVWIFSGEGGLGAKLGSFLLWDYLTAVALLNRLKILNTKKISVKGFSIELDNYLDFYLMFSEIFLKQVYLFQADNEKPFIIDAGSNIGMATIYFKSVYPQSEIICFEPGPETFAILKNNIALNSLKGVDAQQMAVMDQEGSIDFFMHPDRPGLQGVSHWPDAEGVRSRKIEVKAMPLSSFISRPVDLLKLDVEGAEELVINELVKSNKLGMVKEMLIEYHLHFVDQGDLPGFLKTLSQAGFKWQVHTEIAPFTTKRKPAGIMIYACKK
jgi:FkbM family methyltransferase